MSAANVFELDPGDNVLLHAFVLATDPCVKVGGFRTEAMQTALYQGCAIDRAGESSNTALGPYCGGPYREEYAWCNIRLGKSGSNQ